MMNSLPLKKKPLSGIYALMLGFFWSLSLNTFADSPSPHATTAHTAVAFANTNALNAFWTPEKMANAKPAQPLVPPSARVAPLTIDNQNLVPPGEPGGTTGATPKGASVGMFATLSTDTPTQPASATYPSAHTTYQFQGRYRTYPRSTVGRLFFTLNGQTYACSASTISYKHVVTAGHCVSDGAGHWASNVIFCPSYDSSQGGPNPAVGCWTTNTLYTPTQWFNSGEPNADIGVAVYGNNGTVISDYPGNAVGWLSYTWNWPIGQHVEMFGYPSADRAATANNEFADFNGGKIFVTSAEEAGYTLFSGVYDPSKVIGTTQTPGTSGGPWILGYGMKYYNTWNVNAVNGVNSHGRCYDTACTDLTQEVSSPQFFRYGTGDGNCTEPNCGVVDLIDFAMTDSP